MSRTTTKASAAKRPAKRATKPAAKRAATRASKRAATRAAKRAAKRAATRATKRATPSTIDEYLAPLPAAQRAALQRIRQTVRAIVPAAEECISYGLPTFRLEGKAFFYFGAAAHHCAIYGALDKAFADELADFETNGKGTIRFQPNRPLPASLVAKLVRARLQRMPLT